MLNSLLNFFAFLDDFLWGYISSYLCILLAFFLSFNKNFKHFKLLSWSNFKKTFISNEEKDKNVEVHNKKTVSPFKLLMISIGGMVGVGNIVGAVTIGGPGALFWVWIAAIFGIIIKYSEVYLGMIYRKVENGVLKTGPMYIVEAALDYLKPNEDSFFYETNRLLHSFLPKVIAVLLIVYGVEIYVFNITNTKVVDTLNLNKLYCTITLILVTFYTLWGGIKRVGDVCTILVPFMVLTYIIVCLYVLVGHGSQLWPLMKKVFVSAFHGHTAVGGFVGASFGLVFQKGVSRTVYSTDMSIGFDSSVYTKVNISDPYNQAKLSVWALLIDILFCTMSILVVLITEVWNIKMSEEQYVTYALRTVINSEYVNYFMMIFIFTTGWTTVLAWAVVAQNSFNYLFKETVAKVLFFTYATFMYFIFSFVEPARVYPIMGVCSAILFVIIALSILTLRHKIKVTANKT